MNFSSISNRALVAVCLTTGLLFSANANAGAVIAAFDFENVAENSFTAAASAAGAGVTGAVFGGTRGDSRVIGPGIGFADNTYTSSGLAPTTSGTFFNFFSFTTSTSLDLGALSFEAGHNDRFPSSDRTFEGRLSPVGTGTPAGNFGAATAGWSLLSAITMPFGFANSQTPNFNLDLTGTTLGPGTYQIAFGAQTGVINEGSAQLFMDDVTLSAADVEVPAPGTLALFGLGILGLGLARRRRTA